MADVTKPIALDETLQAVNETLGEIRDAIGGGGGGAYSNRNLLDNPWFTVNQRGATTITSGYGADRWKCAFSGVTFGDKSCTVLAGGALIQIFDFDDFTGKVTISVKLSNGTIQHTTVNYLGHSEFTTFSLGDFTVQLGTYPAWGLTSAGIVLYNNAQTSATIKAIKLELGSVTTLANDVAPDYGEELRKCQRYFQRIKAVDEYTTFGVGVSTSSSVFSTLINLYTEMRAKPVCTYNNTNMIVLIGNDIYNVSSMSFDAATSTKTIRPNIASPTPYEAHVAGFLMSNNSTVPYIDCSADL